VSRAMVSRVWAKNMAKVINRVWINFLYLKKISTGVDKIRIGIRWTRHRKAMLGQSYLF